ncbi:serine protease [Streptomyces sp. HD]|uniref:serine protease n=1 Tax=Streptomyces sp. HD TaxID=3020892 RepID=UPI00232B6578|nr:serine protease [Streptomyces sp. HD]MDC0766019.1 NACHT domain-containing protein [Streptomyces sp. HD]
MIAGRVADRVVAVFGAGQGSGVLFGRRMVLTAQHVVDGSDVIEVIHPSSRRPVRCEVLWADESLDVAALRVESEVISAGRAAPLGWLRKGSIATRSPLSHCQIVGFPRTQRYGDLGEDLEYDQYRTTVLPMAGRMRDVLVCELDVPAADERGGGDSPLAGLSGAPVFAGAVLLGVVTQVPRGRSHLRIEGAPMEAVMAKSAERILWPGNFEQITDVHPEDESFEARYAKDLAAQYRKTEIFGIEELGRTESRWNLDTAYLSLEAETTPDMHQEAGSSAERIDTLLRGRPRTLLRGQAGAGKTTLVWWLAAHAANGSLNEDLAKLNGLVPFVVPMREVYARGGRFPAVSELLSAVRVLSENAPDGWAGRVLEAGRGLLLVDGLDEVPPLEREKARHWLCALLDRYPDTRCLATVRPDAVEKDWLHAERFEELTLLPMSDEDIEAFVTAWHNAARLECEYAYDTGRCGDERDLLISLEQDLVHQLGQNQALRDLARTPLLCAVICALHRRRRGLLPTTRWSLYRAALAMLLGGRDAGRGVAPDDITLDSDEQHVLLQRLAIWLIRTGRQQMSHEQASHQLDLAMRDMPQFRDRTTPDRVLRFLLERSGLLQERTDDAIQFIHRTFQDFLAAKEFNESGYVFELLRHASDPTWRDVIVLAVGHATRMDAQHVIEKLIEFGDAAEERERKWYLHLLAAQCVTSLLALNPEVMGVVRERVRRLMPPRSHPEGADVTSLGAWAVDLLPGPEGLQGGMAVYTVDALTRIRTAEARQRLHRYAAHSSVPNSVADCIVSGWQRQPAEEYAREVLAGSRIRSLAVVNSAQLAQLPHLGSISEVIVVGSYPVEELDAHLPVRDIEAIGLWHNQEIAHLDFLRQREHLRVLTVQECTALEHGEWLTVLGGLTSLERLTFHGDQVSALEILRAASGSPRLARLNLLMGSLRSLTDLAPLFHVRELTFVGLRDYADVMQVRRVFPNLTVLTLGLALDAVTSLDLTDLRHLPGLRVRLTGTVMTRPPIAGSYVFGARFEDHLHVFRAITEDEMNAVQVSDETAS